MRRTPDIAKATILGAAVNLSRTTPYHQVSLRNVANAAECSSSLVLYHFKTMDALRDGVVSYALEHDIITILGHAIVQRHPMVQTLPPAQRDICIRELTG